MSDYSAQLVCAVVFVVLVFRNLSLKKHLTEAAKVLLIESQGCGKYELARKIAISLGSVAEHHSDICKCTLEIIFNDSAHKLRKLMLPLHESKYNLRHARSFSMSRCKTNKFKNSFTIASCALVSTV